MSQNLLLLTISKCTEPLNLKIQSYLDINSIQIWRAANYMIHNIGKTKVMFSRKTNIQIYDYKFYLCSITRTDSAKGLGIFLGSIVHFHKYVNYVFLLH
jgi:hypothetical protein